MLRRHADCASGHGVQVLRSTHGTGSADIQHHCGGRSIGRCRRCCCACRSAHQLYRRHRRRCSNASMRCMLCSLRVSPPPLLLPSLLRKLPAGQSAGSVAGVTAISAQAAASTSSLPLLRCIDEVHAVFTQSEAAGISSTCTTSTTAARTSTGHCGASSTRRSDKASLVEIIPGKGSGQLKKHVLAVPRPEGGQGPVPPGREGLQELRSRLRPLPLEVAYRSGLTADQLRERAIPPSSLSLIGLVRHMAEVESNWFLARAGRRGNSDHLRARGGLGGRVPRRSHR